MVNHHLLKALFTRFAVWSWIAGGVVGCYGGDGGCRPFNGVAYKW